MAGFLFSLDSNPIKGSEPWGHPPTADTLSQDSLLGMCAHLNKNWSLQQALTVKQTTSRGSIRSQSTANATGLGACVFALEQPW